MVPTPIDSIDLPPIAQISCGGLHTALLTEHGKAFTFGYGENGQLGHVDEDEEEKHLIPKMIASIDIPIIQVSCGGAHTALLAKREIIKFPKQCKGITKIGKRCSRMVRAGEYCWQHLP